MRILLIEDSERLRRSVGTGLKKAGFKVDQTGDGTEGLWYAESFEYDVIILDLMLPGLDGLSILRRLRKKERPVYVLILSAKDTVDARVTGLQAGADDYLVKPFAFDELLARVHALIRRKYNVQKDIIAIDDLRIDLAKQSIARAGKAIDLPPREFRLLEFLALQQGTVVSREKIEQHIYDERAEPMSNVVDAAICSLRKKIDKPDGQSVIKTRRGLGYIIE